MNPWDLPINPDRIDSDALSLLAWANADGNRRVSDLDAARQVIYSKGRRFNPDHVPELDLLEANNAFVKGQVNSPHVLNYQNAYLDFYGLNGSAAANAAKINSTLSSPSSQPMQQGTGGATLDPVQAGMATADLVTSVLPSRGSGGVEELVQQKAQARGLGSINLDAPADVYPDIDTGSVNLGSAPEPNVSGGGPGTSTAKGHGNVKRQMAKRGLLETADAALGSLDLGIGHMAQKGMQRAGAAARAGGMKNLGNALYRAGGAARVLAPAAAVGGAVLPAVFGAMDGYEQAGAGGALIQGGSGAAGALAGGAIGTAILPGVGTVIGAGIGSMLGSGAGSGLTGLAQGAVEKAQQGDTGFMGSIGRALDPLIDTPFEAEQKAVLQQMNSPAMKAIQEQERTRQAQARAQQSQQLLMQSYMQVI